MFLNRLLLFIMALCLGSLLVRMHLPIPFLLGGLLTALLCKTLTHRSDVSWPKQWSEYTLMVAGYGIGSTFTADTWNNFLAELVGVAEATIVILAASFSLCSKPDMVPLFTNMETKDAGEVAAKLKESKVNY